MHNEQNNAACLPAKGMHNQQNNAACLPAKGMHNQQNNAAHHWKAAITLQRSQNTW
jgi:hypothetical protein